MSDARERADRLVREWAGADWSPIYARLKERIEHEIIDVLARADTLATELTEQLRAAHGLLREALSELRALDAPRPNLLKRIAAALGKAETARWDVTASATIFGCKDHPVVVIHSQMETALREGIAALEKQVAEFAAREVAAREAATKMRDNGDHADDCTYNQVSKEDGCPISCGCGRHDVIAALSRPSPRADALRAVVDAAVALDDAQANEDCGVNNAFAFEAAKVRLTDAIVKYRALDAGDGGTL